MSEDLTNRTVVTESARFADGAGPATIELSEQGDTAVVRLRGSVDAALTPSLRDALTWAVRHHQAVFVDLSGVPSVDASGLGVLARAQRRAVGLGAAFCLVAPSHPVLSALRVLRPDARFALVDAVPAPRRRPRSGVYRRLLHSGS